MEMNLFLLTTAVFGVAAYAMHHYVTHNFFTDIIKVSCWVIGVSAALLSVFTIAEFSMDYPAYYGNEASISEFFDKIFVMTFYALHPALHILVFSAILACTIGIGALWGLIYVIDRHNRRSGHSMPTPLD